MQIISLPIAISNNQHILWCEPPLDILHDNAKGKTATYGFLAKYNKKRMNADKTFRKENVLQKKVNVWSK